MPKSSSSAGLIAESISPDPRALKLKEIKLKQKKLELLESLPHLYGFPFYKWQRDFFESRKKIVLLTAANQIGKSTSQIKKMIHLATSPDLWAEYWPKRRPRQFWYFYPSKDVATIEFKTKWEAEFLPRGQYKDHPQYGWRADFTAKDIVAIHFNTGVSIYYKTYKQDPQTLATGTCDYVGLDEELPEHLWAELRARLYASSGYLSAVFTPTLNQEMWRRAMECVGEKEELFPEALKMQISMYDCLQYEDGSETPWTLEKIRKIEQDCTSKMEIARRIHGKFVQESGRKYPTFDPDIHYISPFPIRPDHHIYTAVDIGGGGTSHPAAMVFIACEPDYKKGYVIRTWRGDGIETTSGDILQKYIELRGNLKPISQFYDWQAKDFGMIAARSGESFLPADKSRNKGEDILNTLFRNGMLFIFDTEENRKLGGELLTLMNAKLKNHAKDDLCDAFRYASVSIPWDWTAIDLNDPEKVEKVVENRPLTEAEYQAWQIRERRGENLERDQSAWGEISEEFDYWNSTY